MCACSLVDLLGLAEVERARPKRRDWRHRYSSDGSADRRRSVWLGKGRRWERAAYCWPRLSISVGSFSRDVEEAGGSGCWGRLATN